MNDTISSVLERKSIAPLVRFERHLEEDKLASLAQGRAVTRDVDFAIITPPYSKDEVFKEALAFLRDNKIKVARLILRTSFSVCKAAMCCVNGPLSVACANQAMALRFCSRAPIPILDKPSSFASDRYSTVGMFTRIKFSCCAGVRTGHPRIGVPTSGNSCPFFHAS